MRSLLVGLFALLPLGCETYQAPRDTATQLNADRRFAHSSNGDIVLGPSYIDETVIGQVSSNGNVHVATDHWFLRRADSLASLQQSIAQLAPGRTNNPDVLAMARATSAEQYDVEKQVRQLAASRAFRMDPRFERDEEEAYLRLASLQGAAFDRAYLETSVAFQRQQLALWDDALATSGDKEITRLASRTEPSLRANHNEATRELNRM
jgi:predicted outer membrane protein